MTSLRPALVLALLVPAASARAVTIAHEGAGCVIAERYPRFEARLDPADEVARARVFFRTAGTPHWYSVDMTAGASGFTGVLPKPRRATPRIEYYVEASDRAFASTRTPERTVDVVGSAAECRKDAVVAPVAASARVLVAAATGAPSVPAGFLGGGLVGAGAGIGAGTLAIVGGGAAVAAGVAVAAGGGADPTTPSTAPPDADLTGSWAGLGADGSFRDWSQGDAVPCRHQDDLFLDLQQTGRTVAGTARYVSRGACGVVVAATFRTEVHGTVDGTRVRLSLTAPLRAGDYVEELVGTVIGSRMEGTSSGTWTDGPRTGQMRGNWSARRP